MITAHVETLTPVYAQELLMRTESLMKSAEAKQRPVKDWKVAEYANAIREDRFDGLNSMTIAIDVNGALLNGRHRALAVVRANKAVDVLVVRGVRPEAFCTIDTGANRNGKDVLAMAGEANATSLAAALQFVHRYESNTLHRSRETVPNDKLYLLLEAHPGLRDSVHPTVRVAKMMRSTATAVGLHYLMGRLSPELRDRFYAGLTTGLNLTAESPIHQLRQRLLNVKLSQVEVAALTIKAFNLFAAGRSCLMLRWVRAETMPRLTVGKQAAAA